MPGRPAPAKGSLGLGLRLIYEDDEVVVIDKPPGLLTAILPGEAGAAPDIPSAFAEVKRHVRARLKRASRVWVIHRLDKEASGLLVFAKTERAFAWLKEDFRSRRAHRLYLAVVEGEFGPGATSGTLQGFVAEDTRGLMRTVDSRRTVAGPGDQAPPQLAVTHYRVIAAGNGRSLVQLRLQTGRKNQIRVQMSEAGHPLLGDQRYRGTATSAPDNSAGRLCLHAVELGFAHPSRGEAMRFSSPAPESFWKLVGARPPEVPQEVPGKSSHTPNSERTLAAPTPVGRDDGPTTPAPSPAISGPALNLPVTSWDHVAGWYEDLLDQGRSDHQRDVIVPGALRLLRPVRGMRVLDVACGEGSLCRKLSALGVEAVGVDASPRLIERARTTSRDLPMPARFEVGDARTLSEMKLGEFDAATCVMAIMNIDPVEPVLRSVSQSLKPGGALVLVLLHPAFRAPGQTSWGWDERPARRDDRTRPPRDRDGRARQFRRVDGYLSPGQAPIVMNPGKAAHGQREITTWTFHRPIQFYAKALAEAGLLIEAIEEWPSVRRSQPGPRATEENRARREIPLFLGLRAVRK